jgi:5-methylcytosine-specific restriction endonuclease McrA
MTISELQNPIKAGKATLYPENTFDKQEYEFDELEYEECKNPSCTSTTFKIETKANYQLVQRCAVCGEWQKNIPKKESTSNRNSSSKYSITEIAEYHHLTEPSCFFCRRKKPHLPDRHGLEIDHIREINNEEGQDRIENLQILCTKCHKLKNHERKYNNWDMHGKPSEKGVEP